MANELLLAEGLSKVFQRRGAEPLTAVHEVNLAVQRGDVFGFLGPNGAGKSTTIRMMLGLIHPTTGRVSIGGRDLATQRLLALRKVGAFVEAPSFYGYLTGQKNLEIFTGLSGGCSPDEIARVVELVGLRGREHDPVKVYSHGMRQRLGIAACLLPRPELLVLDEPTDGLDPHGIHETRELIKRLAREEGLTIFLSSHMLSEVENLCNRIAILDRGRIILEGELVELEKRFRRLEIHTDRPAKAAALLLEKFRLQSTLTESGVLNVEQNGTSAAEVNATLVGEGFAVNLVARERNWLDRIFLELTTKQKD